MQCFAFYFLFFVDTTDTRWWRNKLRTVHNVLRTSSIESWGRGRADQRRIFMTEKDPSEVRKKSLEINCTYLLVSFGNFSNFESCVNNNAKIVKLVIISDRHQNKILSTRIAFNFPIDHWQRETLSTFFRTRKITTGNYVKNCVTRYKRQKTNWYPIKKTIKILKLAQK